MNFKTLNTINAFLSTLNGGFFLFAPALSVKLMSRSTNAMGLVNTQQAGAMALGIMVILWLSRNVTDPQFQRIICAGIAVMFAGLVYVEIAGLWAGTYNWIGWMLLAVDATLGVLYARLYLKLRDETA